MHIHLDALGGISGNMFLGAILDLWPQLAAQLPLQLERAGFAGKVALEVGAGADGALQGTLVQVRDLQAEATAPSLTSKVAAHPHRYWRDIRALLAGSALEPTVKTHALGIFGCLASAEAKVHGTPVDEVEFHEVGAWDSIADIVCAASLIAASGASSWSVSSLPLGRGRVASAHGELPVPAPAVVSLLQGFSFHDDGREGERVTPTGAAILHYLRANQPRPATACLLRGSGQGFGTRRFAGLSNVLRALVFEAVQQSSNAEEEVIAELAFEIDDQNAEDLALALTALRRHPGVFDVLQYPVLGKKQRQGCSLRVLCSVAAEAEVRHLCFTETTTLGIRHQHVARSVLPRFSTRVALDGREYRVKLARRPDGEFTAKLELEELAQLPLNQAERQLLREVVESLAIDLQQRRTAVVLPAEALSDEALSDEGLSDEVRPAGDLPDEHHAGS